MSKNYLSIFKGSINDEENVIIIDANRNKDLTDDSVYHVKNRDALVF